MIIIRTLRDKLFKESGTAVALGIFDGVHLGHQQVLRAVVKKAAAFNLIPCVFTFAFSQPRPNFKKISAITGLEATAALLNDIGIKYAVAPDFSSLKDMEPEEFVRNVLQNSMNAKMICAGESFTFAKGGAATADDLVAIADYLEIKTEIIPTVLMDGNTVSSTRIRALLISGDMHGANRMLGRTFSIDFPVVSGNKIGRTLGTPTINQLFPEDFIVPRYGVYATVAKIDSVFYSGVTNVGIRPTIRTPVTSSPLAETYINGFSGDLYGRRVEILFIEFIRPEKKFSSLEELRENIQIDIKTAEKIVAERRYENAMPDILDSNNKL